MRALLSVVVIGTLIAAPARAGEQRFIDACAHGSPHACTESGNGALSRGDDAAAAGFYFQGCVGEDQDGCVMLGTLREAGRDKGRDWAAETARVKAGCDRHSGNDCFVLAMLVDLGLGAPPNATAAGATLETACAAEPRACAVLSG